MLAIDQIHEGDARELGDKVEPESIDLILTDPPYPKEYLGLYEWLGEFAARTLKPGCYLMAYGAGEYMPQHLNLLAAGGLDYFWVDALLHSGGYPRMWHKRLMSAYKPVYIFTKGTPTRRPWRATAFKGNQDKRFHEWGQGMNYFLKAIEMLTESGDLVCDPFVGGGAVAAACIASGRRYLAFENDPETASRARSRLETEQPPLLVLEPEHAQARLGMSND